MKKLLLIAITLTIMGCIKGQKDTAFTYNCTTICKIDPFTYTTKDTTFFNMTDGEANLYIRASSVNGCNTTCEKQ